MVVNCVSCVKVRELAGNLIRMWGVKCDGVGRGRCEIAREYGRSARMRVGGLGWSNASSA